MHVFVFRSCVFRIPNLRDFSCSVVSLEDAFASSVHQEGISARRACSYVWAVSF